MISFTIEVIKMLKFDYTIIKVITVIIIRKTVTSRISLLYFIINSWLKRKHRIIKVWNITTTLLLYVPHKYSSKHMVCIIYVMCILYYIYIIISSMKLNIIFCSDIRIEHFFCWHLSFRCARIWGGIIMYFCGEVLILWYGSNMVYFELFLFCS